jgi:hypothetical protein
MGVLAAVIALALFMDQLFPAERRSTAAFISKDSESRIL